MKKESPSWDGWGEIPSASVEVSFPNFQRTRFFRGMAAIDRKNAAVVFPDFRKSRFFVRPSTSLSSIEDLVWPQWDKG